MNIDMLRPRSLQQRTVVFILVPIFLILTTVGIVGYFSVRNVLIKQWSETAIANLQGAANHIDMQLSRPKLLLMLLQNTLKYDDNQETQNSVQNAIIDRLREIKGVVSVSC